MDHWFKDRHQPVSIHAPHAEGDSSRLGGAYPFLQFQSTPPMRRATKNRPILRSRLKFQSTPPMRRATAAGPTVSLTTA